MPAPMAKPKVLFVQNIAYYSAMDQEAADEFYGKMLSDDRVEIVQPTKGERKLEEKEMLAFLDQSIHGVSSIFINTFGFSPPVEYLDRAGSSLKAITVAAAGYETMPLQEYKKRGIKFANAPDGIVQATAQTTFILTLWAMRDFKRVEKLVTSKEWTRIPNPGFAGMHGLGLEGKTVGVVGMGRLGQCLIPLFAPWGLRKILYTTSKPGRGVREDFYGHVQNATFPVEIAKDLGQLASESDVLIVTVDLNDSTRHLINKDVFAKMKKTGVLVNVARGGIVDTKALLEALKSETIYSAGLDVIEGEWSKHVLEHQELIEHPRCVVLPHVGSAIARFRVKAVAYAIEGAIAGALGEKMRYEIPL